MATYTTQVRDICESFPELTSDAHTVDWFCGNAVKYIFDGSFTTFDPAYKPILCKKILKHFYMSEIGFETYGLWKLQLNTKLEEIMPYYNQLYYTTTLDFNPLWNVDYTTTRNRTGNEKSNENTTVERTTAEETSYSDTEDGLNKYSETPQQGLTGLLDDSYLTNATKNDVTRTGGTERSSGDTSETIGERNRDTTEDYVSHVVGLMGGRTSAQLINEYRQNLLNIDMMIINELEPLFMGVF